MAGPLINLLQGLQQRRQRRRSGWGGGDVPSMRNIINPLDSQDMTDRAQGIDIGSAAPMARLEARMAPPPQVAAQEDSEPAEAAPARSPFMTAAGSNAKPMPMSNNQYGVRQYIQQQPAQCTGPNCPGGSGMGMGSIISE
ncbi:MAG: hypothetical protein EBV03_13845, partial [Proteobacteria bacterium]|nr:hypothetical protein [Pseudomonadota bacterium]